MERLTYSVAEVAELLGISRSKAYELVAEGAIPVVPLRGRRKLVARRAIDDLLNGPTRSSKANALQQSRTGPYRS